MIRFLIYLFFLCFVSYSYAHEIELIYIERERLLAIGILVLFGVIAGIAYKSNNQKLTFRFIIREIISGVFAGFVAYLICNSIHDFNSPAKALIYTLSAFGGSNAVDLIYNSYKRLVEKYIEKKVG